MGQMPRIHTSTVMSWIVISRCCFLSQALRIGVVARNQTEKNQTGVTIVFACECGDGGNIV